MKTTTFPKVPNLFSTCLLIFLLPFLLIAQVGIGTTTPNPDALLDVDASTNTGGLLLPRLGLTATTNVAPLSAHVAGMLVYNTATSMDVTPGYYYNDGGAWVRVGGSSSGSYWNLNGNGGTTAGTHYVGTSDNSALRFKTASADAFEISGGAAANRGRLTAFADGTAALPVYSWNGDNNTGIYHADPDVVLISTAGVERLRLLANGQVAQNNAAPVAGDRFTVTGTASEFAINGYSVTDGIGVYGENPGTGYGVWGNSANIGVYGTGGAGVYGESGASNGFGSISVNTNASGTGALMVGNNSAATYLTSGTGLSSNGSNGIFGYGRTTTGVGVIGTGANSTNIVTYTGAGLAGSSTIAGVFGYAGNGDDVVANEGNAGGIFILDSDNNLGTAGNNDLRATAVLAGYDNLDPGGTTPPTSGAADVYYGGYFSGGNESGTPTYAYVGLRYNSNGAGNATGTTIDYKIVGTGNVSTLVKDESNSPRVLFAPEAPEIVFQDYGVGNLRNGEARIDLDPLLSRSIFVDEANPLKVFVTLEGECNGVYVTNKSAEGFTVKELQNGNSNVPFSWQIVASRGDTRDINGRVISKHVGVRFPAGPGKRDLKAPVTEKVGELSENSFSRKASSKKKNSLKKG
jgi:hypothetical protein